MKSNIALNDIIIKAFNQIGEGILIVENNKFDFPILYANKSIFAITGIPSFELI